jgi:ElaB/YqjD/DUF883 family membrane-anchored ribosome-binding protein
MADVRSSLKDLQQDLQAVARDAEALLRATADISSEKVQAVRSQTEDSLKHARGSLRLARLQAPLRNAYESTNAYVRAHPWAFLGAAAGTALLVGLARRRSTARPAARLGA